MDQDETWHAGRPRPWHILLDVDPAPPPPYLLLPNGCMDQDATWYGGRPRPRRLCVKWGPSCPSPERGGAPNFPPMSIVAKRLHASRCHLVRKKIWLRYCGQGGMETVQVTPLRRTLASSPKSKCTSCLQCFDTVGWVAGRASGL